jgi:hypothetical protein
MRWAACDVADSVVITLKSKAAAGEKRNDRSAVLPRTIERANR